MLLGKELFEKLKLATLQLMLKNNFQKNMEFHYLKIIVKNMK